LKLPAFFTSIRAKLLLVSLVLLLIPLIGFRFVKVMDRYLREGQQQVLLSAARFLSASLSNRPDLIGNQASSDTSDDVERRRLISAFGNRDPELLRALGGTYRPSEQIERMLAVVAKDASRIWVVDSRQSVRGLEGSLSVAPAETARGAYPRENKTMSWLQSSYRAVMSPLVSTLVKSADGPISEDAADVKRIIFSQVDRALGGEPTVMLRATRDAGTGVQSAAQPIWLGDDIVAAVVIEESDQSSRAIQIAVLEALLAMTLLVFAVGFVALMSFAWRLAFRVRRLQAEAARAIDTHGRITGAISGADSRDEIGALAATLEEILARLKRYNSYLEQMASRLAHELRTPLAVVRSSLDNLRHTQLAATDRIYIERAEEGIRRLSALISRMSEASQLEQFLQGAERDQFDLSAVVSGCVDGYRLAYSERRFEFRSGGQLRIDGVPDAVAQLLDKLVHNAVDFAEPATPIVVTTAVRGRSAILAVENRGRTMSDAVLSQLFKSMVTDRSDSNPQHGHLGLGLYIVQLVAEFHGGSASAYNLTDSGGVRFEVSLPLN
jgi:signal transduction histidine kinase